ncbi:hypothetical protein Dsin_029002 [Dipteronia sinensis]|uniref:Reverse transcriptase zinc-binding domain-containing protein n=1 Tax=Dipteronia sinensis TaxID=43782 RepID=A0AAD9ZTA5_9ROSI|nr:hypothetical protein Dsin_029002 [Dipteronia sinensis]
MTQIGLPWTLSDNNVIMIGEKKEDWGPCPFRFYNGWLEEKELINAAVKEWVECKSGGSKGVVLASKIKACKLGIKRWLSLNKKTVSSLKRVEEKLAEVERKATIERWTEGLRKERIHLLSEYWKGLRKEEQMWRQKARVKWLNEGDTKSKFFHYMANGRKRKVWEAVTRCDGNKVPGPDGMNLSFIRHNWKVIQEYFMKFMHEFHKDSSIVKELNNTFLALIPKCVKQETMRDFRPISLVGSLYKVLSKVLANRLKKGEGVVKRKSHLIGWDLICKRKKNGGLEVARILDMNKGLLAKWVWRYGNDDNPLWRRVLKAKYGISENSKHKHVQEFGRWNGNKWVWKVELRRPLFDWELDQWRCFLLSLENIPIHGNVSDAVAWVHNSNGLFLVRSFQRCLEEEDSVLATVPNLIWQGICPPKIEVFVWQLIKGRVMVKDYMKRFDKGNTWNTICPLCNVEDESVDHIFLHLWEARNEVVFRGKEADLSNAADTMKFRIAWWFKHYRKGSTETMMTILLNLRECCVKHNKAKKCSLERWMPPTLDVLKFNVDWSAKGSPGPAGMGGVLRNSRGCALCLFSDHLGTLDSNSVEVSAIHKAVEICASSPHLIGR